MLKRVFLITLALVAFNAFAPARAADLQTLHTFSIPAQALDTALLAFSDQAKVQVLLWADAKSNAKSPGANGELRATDALKALLENTGLTYQKIDESTVAIRAVGSIASVEQRLLLARADSAASAEGDNKTAESDKGSSDKIEEVIVTAQRREERLQDVPISITVLQGEELDKSTQGAFDALSRVPGVAIQDGGNGQAILTVRGVSGPGVGAGSNPIGYYLDAAPFSMVRYALVPEANVYDLERIEVLRGPQGTLYGATSQNGVIRILTKDPDLNKFEAKMRGGISSTTDGGENYRGDAAVNMPIVEDKLAVRGAVSASDRSGWIDRPNHKNANNEESSSVRLKVAAKPSEKLSIGLSAWLYGRDSDAAPAGTVERTNPSRVDEPNDTNYNVYAMKVGYDFPAFSLTSTTSYLKYHHWAVFDNDGAFGQPNVTLTTRFDSRALAEEVSLNSTGEGPWRWSLGAIYRDEEDHFLQWRRTHVNPNGNRFRETSESEALYGMLTRLFLDGRFELTGGLRYFEDSQVNTELSNSGNPNAVLVTRHTDFDAVSPRAALTWHATDSVMTYLSYSEGFRSGYGQAPYLGLPLTYPPVKGDNLANYELGTKASFWDGRAAVEAAVFYMDWQDIQQQIQVISGTGTVVAGINGESASGMGAEIGISLRPIPRLTLSASYAWNDLVLDADVIQPNGTVIFRKGDRTVNSPQETAGIAATYNFPVGGSGYEGSVSASANYVSQREARGVSLGQVILFSSDVMQTAQLSASVNSPKGWGVTAFVDNLTDEEGSPNSAYQSNGPFTFARIQPRTVGLQMEYKFGR